jgi:adenylate kinase
MFRKNISEGTELGKIAKSYMDKGDLVPDEVTISMVQNRLKEADCSNGFLLDGFPRNMLQAKKLDSMLSEGNKAIDGVFHLSLPREVILERLAGRRFCVKCGSSYHIKCNPPRVKDICDSCGADLIQRVDDREEVIIERLEVYDNTIRPLVDYYTATGKLFKVQSGESIEAVFSNISTALKAI